MKRSRNIFSNKGLVLSSYRQYRRVVLNQAVQTLELPQSSRFIRLPLKQNNSFSSYKILILFSDGSFAFKLLILIFFLN